MANCLLQDRSVQSESAILYLLHFLYHLQGLSKTVHLNQLSLRLSWEIQALKPFVEIVVGFSWLIEGL